MPLAILEQVDDSVRVPLTHVPPPIVNVYFRRQQTDDKCSALDLSSYDSIAQDLDLPIGLRKGKR